MFSFVLIAIDGWEHSTRLLDLAKRVCMFNTRVEIIYIDNSVSAMPVKALSINNDSEVVLSSAEQIMQDSLDYLRLTANITAHGLVVNGDAASIILKHAKEIDCDLIVMGHRHLSKLARFFEPSVTITVIKDAHCPVLVDSFE